MNQQRKGEVTFAMIVLTIALFTLFTVMGSGYDEDVRDQNVTKEH